MARFDSAIALAIKLIAKNGQTATLRTYTDAAPPDANKPWRVGDPTTSDQTVTVVFIPQGAESSIEGTVNYEIGGQIHIRQERVYMSTDGVTTQPNLKDKLIVGTREWAVEDIRTLSPNGQDVLYELLVRN